LIEQGYAAMPLYHQSAKSLCRRDDSKKSGFSREGDYVFNSKKSGILQYRRGLREPVTPEQS
jgi:hypothetical protein